MSPRPARPVRPRRETSPAARLAAATPAGRDRYVDLLRVASLAVVVVGHWTMAAVTVGADGALVIGNLLAEVPALQVLTWLFQVMPVFFLVGGFSHALAYRSLRRRAEEAGATGSVYPAFLRTRLRRLLLPVAVFAGVWAALALLLETVLGDGAVPAVLRLVAQPLWFIGVYLAMAALTPPMLRLHERWGWGAFAALVAGVVLVDTARFAGGVPYVEFLNFALVWLAVHQLGFLRADGRLHRPGVAPALALGGLLSAAALVWVGPYPLSMVGMPGEEVSNMAPPTLALLCHGLWLAGAVELMRRPAARALAVPAVWRAVVAANGTAMTAFLWHLTAMLAVYATLVTLHVPLPEPASGAWWAQAPVRLAVAAGVTAGLVALFRRLELPGAGAAFGGPGSARTSPGSVVVAAVGVTLALFGVLGVSMTGFGGMLTGHSATLVVLPVTTPFALLLVAVGWALVVRAGGGKARPRGAGDGGAGRDPAGA
ncbi:acyltransferase family protein [Streptomyces lonarensis]|uniref:Acyltransferase n=1 Tax=Streptomyces lonarensis TaxID=700599 RepID=A0A7X6I1I8_9ACTN|nr:acyltransferase [Streptomyces lonarensis]NJQ08580.1 acyltransferase [Streptomyces lonarensis]